MEKQVLHFAFHLVLVLAFLAECNAVPWRIRREAQDQVTLNDGALLQDYGDGNVQDGDDQLSALEESGSDNNTDIFENDQLADELGTDDLINDLDLISADGSETDHDHVNSTENTDNMGSTDEQGADGLIHDLDIHSDGKENDIDQVGQSVDHAINADGNLEEHSDTDHDNEQLNQGHGNLSSSVVQRAIHPTFESRRTNNSNGQRLVLDSVDGVITHVNVSTHETNKNHHGFLMVDNIQAIENEQARLSTNHPTSRSTTLQHTTTTTTTTTTRRTTTTTGSPERLTVKILNISSQEQTESSPQEHLPISGVVIRQNNGPQSDRESESLDNTNELNEVGAVNTSTEMPQSGDGQVAVLPVGPDIQGPEHEQHRSRPGESGAHHPGVDVPIDGENSHNNHEEGEGGQQGFPRHTPNPVLQTPRRHGDFPEVEPTVTTPRLIILPTPAQLEPEERNNSAESIQPRASVSHPSVENEKEHTEPHNENVRPTSEPDGNHIHSSRVQPTQTEVTPSEGPVEFITEIPAVHRDSEIKSEKYITKITSEKTSTISFSLFPSSPPMFESESISKSLMTSEMPSFSPDLRPTTSESTLKSSATSAASTQSDVESSTSVLPNVLQSSDLNINTGSTESVSPATLASCLQPDSNPCLSPVTQTPVFNDFVVSSSSTPPLASSASFESSTLILVQPSVTQLHASPTVQHASVSSSSSGSFTSVGIGYLSPGLTEGSLAGIGSLVTVQPSQSINQPKETEEAAYTSGMILASSSITSLTSSQLLITPSSSVGVYSSTSPSSPSISTPRYQSSIRSEGYTSQSVTVLTSNSTTKKKAEHNLTTLASTLTTRKKPDSGKEPEKPENQSTFTSTSVVTTTSPTSTTTTPRTLAAVSLSMAPVISTQKPAVLTTPPSVYIEIQLRMGWSQFCVTRSQFISEIKAIVLTEKGYTVEEEQFKMNTGDCGSANNVMEGEHIDIITIELYIVDNDGKLDIQLTTVTSSVISKGFQKSNYLKDKIVSVHTIGRLQPEILPGSRTDRRQAPPAVTMVIVIATVGGVCCVALIILQVVLIHRRIKAKRKQRVFVGHRASLQSMDHVALGVIPKSRPGSGYWNPALDDTMELPEPDEHSHIMNFSALANFCVDTKGIYAEFQTIPFDDVEATSVPVGEEDKNRFANVLPHKHSRVGLMKTPENKAGYINANHVNGYMGEKKVYIATQSPLVNTVEDFWRMVWEQQSRTILMLNPVTQQAKPKQSTCYWPDNLETDCRREFGDYIVTLKKRDVQHDYVDCTLEIMDIERNLKRDIHHFWLTCWSDTGPPEPLSLVKFILDTRPHFESSGSPVIVHCGPGTGRTGVYIAVDMCMRMFEDRRRVDILNCVYKMRSERAGAVQTKDQYNLIYQALNEYAVILSSPSISTRSSVITLHAML